MHEYEGDSFTTQSLSKKLLIILQVREEKQVKGGLVILQEK